MIQGRRGRVVELRFWGIFNFKVKMYYTNHVTHVLPKQRSNGRKCECTY